MKKTKLLCVMSALFLMTACGGTKFKTEWSSDASNHWHAAESGDEKDSLGKLRITLRNGYAGTAGRRGHGR